jgi:hypothetical protein
MSALRILPIVVDDPVPRLPAAPDPAKPTSSSVAPTARDRLVAAVWDIATGPVIYRTDQHLVDLGYQGADAYVKDENGAFILGAVCPQNPKTLRSFGVAPSRRVGQASEDRRSA